jgi:DNA-directed RNA polymerase specialized sigma24 family protein
LEQLTAYQLAEWEEFDKIEPIGVWKHDYEFAYLLSTITNLFISAYGKKGSKLTKPEDYLVKWDSGAKEEPVRQSVEDMKSILMGIAKVQNKNTKNRVK